MKKRLLLALMVGSGVTAMAQSPVQLYPDFQGTNPTSFSEIVTPKQSQSLGKQSISLWYNFMDAADVGNGGAIEFTFYNNNYLFPDSTVVQSYGDGAGGVLLSSASRHQTGQMFDPKSFYYQNNLEILSRYNAYTVDSIMLGYRYRNHIPGTVDTLLIQVYTGAGILLGNLVDQFGNPIEPTAWVAYNRTLDKGSGYTQEWIETLSIDDTTWAEFGFATLAIPTPVNVGANGLIAVTYKYIPGFTDYAGDTLSADWETPAVQNKINEFQPLIGTDLAETEEDSYNHSLSIRRSNKYAASPNDNWAKEFIPGDAWIGNSEYTYISFKVNATNVGVQPIDIASANVYPNPSNGTDNVNIEFTTNETANVSVELFDILGNKVQTIVNGTLEAGKQVASADVSGLTAGIYIYTITVGDQVVSGRLSVVR